MISSKVINTQEMVNMLSSFKSWMERFFERPFYEAEIMRAEMLLENSGNHFPPRNMKMKQLQLNHK